jgi:hypothetical protein
MKDIKRIMLLASSIVLFSFTPETPLSVNSLRERFLKNLFTSWQPNAIDTSIYFLDKDDYGNQTKFYPTLQCGANASYHAWPIRGLATPESKQKVLSLFGASIIKSNLKVAGSYYSGGGMWDGEIVQYDAKGIQAVFNKLYQKPSASFKGIALQRLYNINVKEYARGTVDILVAINFRKSVWDKQVQAYLKEVSTDPDFEMRDFAYETHLRIFNEEKIISTCSPDEIDLIGTMLRRAGDGTLPVLITCLKTVLKDYDSEYFSKNASRF